jgi:hypothetical protein
MRPSLRLNLFIATLAFAAASALAAPPAPEPRIRIEPTPADAPETIPPPTGDADFDAAYARAKVNERTGDYDARLSASFYAKPQMAELLDACQDMHAQRMPVHGYFEFPAGGGYRLVLRPSTPFAACIAAAFEGYAVPEPPARPYVHAFAFAPDAAPAKK